MRNEREFSDNREKISHINKVYCCSCVHISLSPSGSNVCCGVLARTLFSSVFLKILTNYLSFFTHFSIDSHSFPLDFCSSVQICRRGQDRQSLSSLSGCLSIGVLVDSDGGHKRIQTVKLRDQWGFLFDVSFPLKGISILAP